MLDEERAMTIASERARETFKFFWRELSWEYRRIVPGLDLSAVKVAFKTDDPGLDVPPFEYVWIGSIEFDGQIVSGELLNDPRWVRQRKSGDYIEVPLSEICDWMYAMDNKVYGAFTVNILRSFMSDTEREEHDAAWGLDFGDPHKSGITPHGFDESDGSFSNIFEISKGRNSLSDLELSEHPMSKNMFESIEHALKENPEIVESLDAQGWSMLHRESLAGNFTPVSLMLKYGADPKAKNGNGHSAIDLAKMIGWPRIVDLFK